MKHWLIGLLLLGAIQPQLAQTDTATISGQVTLDGKPAAGVVVMLTRADNSLPNENRKPARAITDSDGRYRIANLKAGRVRLMASAPGMVNEEQQSQPYFSGRTLQLNEGEALDNVDFKLIKGGVITGKVTNPQGQPMIATGLQLLQVQADGRKQMMQLPALRPFMLLTDDRGVYRLFGLPPGRYAVAVGANTQNGQVTREGYPMTYHPSATWDGDAAIIEVTPGSEHEDIDIQVKGERRKRYAVTVRVVDEASGKPLAGQAVGYGPVRNEAPGGFYPANPSAITDAQGNARLANVMPGRYGAALAPWRNDQQPLEYFSGATAFEVSNADVEGIEVRAYRGVSVSGSVVVDGVTDLTQTENLMAKLNRGGVWAVSHQNNMPQEPRRLTVNRDGAFQLTNLSPGNLSFYLNQEATQGFAILRTEAEHITSTGDIPLVAGQHLLRARLILAYGSAVIRGQVQIVNGALPSGAVLSVYLGRLTTSQERAEGRRVLVTASGSFVAEGVPPGEYNLVLNVANLPAVNGETAASPLPVTQKIMVPASGEVTVSLTLDLAVSRQSQKDR